MSEFSGLTNNARIKMLKYNTIRVFAYSIIKICLLVCNENSTRGLHLN